jgi:two-component system KDP operon response regulator KdpE
VSDSSAAARTRVLVCEDEPHVLRAVKVVLRQAGFDTIPAESVSDALDQAALQRPDAAILDLLLPDGDGVDIVRELRTWSDMPIILLSAVGEDDQKVRALEEGADDYVVKPFHYQEVAARIRAVLRRRDSRREGPRRIGDLFIDPSRRLVRVGDREVPLANKEFTLLRALAADPHRVFTKEELLRDVWGFRSMGRTRTLDSHASRLRRKLDPETGQYVVNCWGVGYRLLDG